MKSGIGEWGRVECASLTIQFPFSSFTSLHLPSKRFRPSRGQKRKSHTIRWDLCGSLPMGALGAERDAEGAPLRCLDGQAQWSGNLLVAQPLGHPPKYLPLHRWAPASRDLLVAVDPPDLGCGPEGLAPNILFLREDPGGRRSRRAARSSVGW